MPVNPATIEQLKADKYWQHVVDLAASQNLDMAVIEAEVIRAAEEPNITVMFPDELARLKQAAGFVYARYNRGNIVKVEPFTVRILSTVPPRIVSNKAKQKFRLASALVLAQSDRQGSKQALGTINFYDDPAQVKEGYSNADKIQDVKEGMVYKVLLSGSFKEGSYNLGADKRSKFENPTPAEGSIAEVVMKMYPRVLISDLKKFVNKTVAVQANIAISRIQNRKPASGGGQFGIITLIDESLSPQAIQEGKALGVMCNAEDIKYEDGGLVIAIGKVTNSPEYGLGMQSKVIVPVLTQPKVQLDEPTEQVKGPDGKVVKPVDFSEFQEPEA